LVAWQHATLSLWLARSLGDVVLSLNGRTDAVSSLVASRRRRRRRCVVASIFLVVHRAMRPSVGRAGTAPLCSPAALPHTHTHTHTLIYASSSCERETAGRPPPPSPACCSCWLPDDVVSAIASTRPSFLPLSVVVYSKALVVVVVVLPASPRTRLGRAGVRQLNQNVDSTLSGQYPQQVIGTITMLCNDPRRTARPAPERIRRVVLSERFRILLTVNYLHAHTAQIPFRRVLTFAIE